MARYTYRWVLVQMEVIIIIITSLSAAGVFNAVRAPSADSPF